MQLVGRRLDPHAQAALVGDLLEVHAGVRVAADEAEVVVGDAEDRRVVDHAAGVVADGGVDDLADREPAGVARDRRLDERLGVRAQDLPLAQRREVHDDGLLAAGPVLLDRALVGEAGREPVAAVLGDVAGQLGPARVEGGLLGHDGVGVGGDTMRDGHLEAVLRGVDADVHVGALPAVGRVDVVRAGRRRADEVVERLEQHEVAGTRPRLVQEQHVVRVEARVVEEVQRLPALARRDRERVELGVEVLGAVDVAEVAHVLVVLARARERERVVPADRVLDDLAQRVHVEVVVLRVQADDGVRAAHQRARDLGVEAALDARAPASSR